jgi:phage baseplate assembly protein W
MDIAYPFRLDSSVRTAVAEYDEHIRQMIEPILFTSAGERVNRPTFGCGLMELVFEGQSAMMEAYTRMIVSTALNLWLAQRIQLQDVTVTSRESQLTITVTYIVIQTGSRPRAEFRR